MSLAHAPGVNTVARSRRPSWSESKPLTPFRAGDVGGGGTWFSESFHSSFRDSAWSSADPLEAKPSTRNAKNLHANFAGSLRGGSPTPRKRSPAPRRPGSFHTSSSSSFEASASSIVSTSETSANSQDSRKASPSRRRAPKVVEVEASSAALPTVKPEWNVPAFKGDVGKLHLSQREKSYEMRPQRPAD